MRGLMSLILDDGQSAEDGQVSEKVAAKLPQYGFISIANGVLVVIGRALALAAADGEHLEAPAAEFSEKIRVGLDAIDDEDVIGGERFPAEPDFPTGIRGADTTRIHGRANRNTHGSFRNAEVGEHPGLPCGIRAAMAAHRGDEKGAGTKRLELRDGGPSDVRVVGDAARADPHDNALSRRDPPGNACQLSFDFRWNVQR